MFVPKCVSARGGGHRVLEHETKRKRRHYRTARYGVLFSHRVGVDHREMWRSAFALIRLQSLRSFVIAQWYSDGSQRFIGNLPYGKSAKGFIVKLSRNGPLSAPRSFCHTPSRLSQSFS